MISNNQNTLEANKGIKSVSNYLENNATLPSRADYNYNLGSSSDLKKK